MKVIECREEQFLIKANALKSKCTYQYCTAVGLKVAMLEPVSDDKCKRTVTSGDTLSVEYLGELEDGTVFDSSKSRGLQNKMILN